MANRPHLYVVPDIESRELSVDEVISSIAMDALLDAKTAIPPRSVTGFELESAIRNNLDILIDSYLREKLGDHVAEALNAL